MYVGAQPPIHTYNSGTFSTCSAVTNKNNYILQSGQIGPQAGNLISKKVTPRKNTQIEELKRRPFGVPYCQVLVSLKTAPLSKKQRLAISCGG